MSIEEFWVVSLLEECVPQKDDTNQIYSGIDLSFNSESLKEDYEAHMNGIRLKLESMNSSRSPTADTQRYDDYEA